MSITLPLTRDLDGLQVGAASRIADIAKHFPGQLTSEMFETAFGHSYGDKLLENHAKLAVDWATQIIIEAERAASEMPVDGHGVGPDLGDG